MKEIQRPSKPDVERHAPRVPSGLIHGLSCISPCRFYLMSDKFPSFHLHFVPRALLRQAPGSDWSPGDSSGEQCPRRLAGRHSWLCFPRKHSVPGRSCLIIGGVFLSSVLDRGSSLLGSTESGGRRRRTHPRDISHLVKPSTSRRVHRARLEKNDKTGPKTPV